jgi:hypothetical protein
MPLKKGSSKKTISSNIGTLVGDFKESGKIGTSKPASKAKAVKQAVAIAFSKAGKSKPAAMKKGGKVDKCCKMAMGGEVTYVKKKDGNRPVKIC